MAGEIQEAAQRARFLLGVGTEAERERLEAEFFADDDAFQQMIAAEDDLIDAYARGELTDSERRQFEQRFMNSSAGRERVCFARAFAATVPQTAPAAVPVIMPAPGFFASIFGNTAGLRVAFAALAVQANPGFSILQATVVAIHAELDRPEAARAAAARLLEIAPGWTISGFVRMEVTRPELMEKFAVAFRKAGLPE